jgi:ATP-dependent RNA helicase RhlE
VAGLAASLLKEPVRVEVTPVATTAERISQRVHFVEKANKRALLAHLLSDQGIARALVFARTKHGANKVAEQLDRAGVRTDAIHGNKSQNARQKALNDFRNGKVRVLVATDIAARGIDVDGITHVINFDLPNEPESYVHRIGRTARAGNDGIAISFCDAEERAFLRDIEKTIRQQVAVDADHPFHAAHIADGVRHGGSAPAGQRGRGGRQGNPQRLDGSRAEHGGRSERNGRGHAKHRGHRVDGGNPHAADARSRDSNRRHAPGGEQRQHAQARDERHAQSTPGAGGRHRGSNGHRDHGHGAESRERGQRNGQRHEHGKPAGQRPHGERRARQDNGGQQPLKRTHRGERGNAQSGGRPQRFEPVRMR